MKRIVTSTIVLLTLLQSVAARGDDEKKSTAKKAGSAKNAPAKKAVRVSATEAKLADELFQAGRKLFFQGKFLEATKKLQQAVKTNPEKTSYRLLLAKSHRFAKQDEMAVKVLSDLIKTNPDHVNAAVQLAELLSPSKEPARVIAVLEPLLKYKHDYPLYHLLAAAYYEKEAFTTARKYYLEAIKLNANNASDHYQIGNIFLSEKRFAKASQAYQQAERLGHSSGAFHFKLASVYFNLHRYLGPVRKAEVIGGKVGEISTKMYLLAKVPAQKDKFYVAGQESAIYQVAKARSLGVDIFDIHFLEANIWMSARRYKKADVIYARLQEKVAKGDAGLFWYHWSQTALGLGDYDGYIARLKKAIAVEPDVYKATLSDAYLVVANRHNGRGNAEKYIEYLVKAVQTNPLSARLHLSLGDALWLASKNANAVAQYKLVLELEPDHTQRVRLLNRIRRKLR